MSLRGCFPQGSVAGCAWKTPASQRLASDIGWVGVSLASVALYDVLCHCVSLYSFSVKSYKYPPLRGDVGLSQIVFTIQQPLSLSPLALSWVLFTLFMKRGGRQERLNRPGLSTSPWFR